jgi:hypothetical protein
VKPTVDVVLETKAGSGGNETQDIAIVDNSVRALEVVSAG